MWCCLIMVSYVCNNIVLATAMPFNGSINLTDMKYRSLSWSYGYEISVPLLILWLWNFSDSIDLMAMKFQCLCETYGCGISMPLWTLWVWNFSASIDLMAMNSVPLLMILWGCSVPLMFLWAIAMVTISENFCALILSWLCML